MSSAYKATKNFWDNVFTQKSITKTIDKSTGNADLDAGLDWLCLGSETIIDFGCGNGSLLLKCALRGTKNHTGIDISECGIELARQNASRNPAAEFDFRCGDKTELIDFPDFSFDGAILSNIVDNVLPEDANDILVRIHRILKTGGKVFFKVNPYITEQEISEWKMNEVGANLFLESTGLYLWNLTTDDWKDLLTRYFIIEEYREVVYKEFDQYNRLFLLVKRG